MPVTTSIPIRPFSQDEFGEVAYEVVGLAFEVHATLGRMFHEPVYRATLKQLLGDRAVEEFAIHLSHNGFEKVLFLDLLVDSGCPFEFKAASSLSAAHSAQLIQYLMLTGLPNGKLINFGTERVEHRFVNCGESSVHRREFQIERHNWKDDECSRRFDNLIVPLVKDWGTGLTRSLYHQAVVGLLGGPESCNQFTQTFWQEHQTASQPVSLIDRFNAIEISCKHRDVDRYESHLRRFLMHTDLESILWANIVSGCVRLQRIGRGNGDKNMDEQRHE